MKIIHTGSGSVTESDVMLAIASKGIIIAFNTGTEGGAERIAQQEKVDVRHYSVIYNIVEDVDKALKGMLEPTFKEVVDGHAEVRQVFRVARKNSIAGSYVRDGTITRTDQARVLRNGAVHRTKARSRRSSASRRTCATCRRTSSAASRSMASRTSRRAT